jgi:serine/threonine-protein phosphatase PGAM5
MATKTLVLVRHGQYLRKTDDSAECLTTLGRKQARLAGKRLKEYKFDKIHCSTMPRAIETAAIICKEMGVTKRPMQTDNLCECVPGFPAHLRKKYGRTDEAILKKHQRQADRAFKTLFTKPNRNTTELLVCHGNIIRYLVCKTLGIDTLTWMKMDIQQCGISVIKISTTGDYGRVLITHNDVGHIPADQRTFI